MKGQVEMDNYGLLKCPHFDSLITFLASSAKIEPSPNLKFMCILKNKMLPSLQNASSIQLVGGGEDVCLAMCSIFNLGYYVYIIKADMNFRGPRNDSSEDRLYIKKYIFKLEGT